MTYMFINILCLITNFSYFFFFGQLKFKFRQIYFDSINRIYICLIDTAIIFFKLKKEKTDVIEEKQIQKINRPYFPSSSDTNNVGFNLLEYIVNDSIEISMNKYSNKYLPNVDYENENNINNIIMIEGILKLKRKIIPENNEIMN